MVIGRDRFGVAVSAKCLIPGKTLTGAMCPGQAFTKPLCLLGTGSILKKEALRRYLFTFTFTKSLKPAVQI